MGKNIIQIHHQWQCNTAHRLCILDN